MKTEAVTLPETVDDAREVVSRFEQGAREVRGDEDVADTVGQHRFEDRTELAEEKWLGSEEEERNA